MKIKAACIGTPKSVLEALSGGEFASKVLSEVIGEVLGVKDVFTRPAEYYVQYADEGPSASDGVMGVEVRLTGVSRNGRTPKMFHSALEVLGFNVAYTVRKFLLVRKRCQIFCVIMLDGEVETTPGSGQYSSSLEGKAIWVEGEVNPK